MKKSSYPMVALLGFSFALGCLSNEDPYSNVEGGISTAQGTAFPDGAPLSQAGGGGSGAGLDSGGPSLGGGGSVAAGGGGAANNGGGGSAAQGGSAAMGGGGSSNGTNDSGAKDAAQEAAAPACDGAKVLCPLQDWMQNHVKKAADANDGAALAAAFDVVGKNQPASGYPNFKTIADGAATKARGNDVAGAKTACDNCHGMYRAKYQADKALRPTPLKM